ncbi:MAG: hypothetical protein AB9834_17745 [Lentimicrobium sp.]
MPPEVDLAGFILLTIWIYYPPNRLNGYNIKNRMLPETATSGKQSK